MRTLICVYILFFLSHCGYTAIYKDKKQQDIKISILEYNGDKKINKLLDTELKNYISSDSENEYFIIVDTYYKKKTNTKDATGKAIDFQLNLITKVIINYNNEKISTTFNESFKIKNSSDTFELIKYENSVKNNFVKSTKNKLILKLLSLNDS